MKRMTYILTLLLVLPFYSFTVQDEIKSCYHNFNKASGLKKQKAERLYTDNKLHALATAAGQVTLTVTNGYSINYLNKKKAPFVTVKVEQCTPESYAGDKEKVLAHLQYLSDHRGGNGKKPTELDYNGFKAYGSSATNLDEGDHTALFVIFPGDDTIIYLYFNKLDKAARNYNTIEEHNGYRNNFIGEYTAYLRDCAGK